MALKELFVLFTANTKDVDTKIRRLNKEFADTTKRINRVSQEFRSFGRSASLFLTTPILALGASSVLAQSRLEGLEATLTSVLNKYKLGIPINQAVSQEMEFMRKTADDLGVSLESIQKPYVKYLAASKDSIEDTRKVAKSFIGLGAALQLTPADMTRVMRSIEQMQSKTKIMSEELKLQLGDTMPGAISLFAKAMDVTESKFLKLMETGSVSSDLLKKVADVINTDFKEAIELGASSTRGQLNRLSTAFFLLRSSMGRASEEVFNIKDGLIKLTSWFNNAAKDLDMLNDSGKKLLLWTVGFLVAIGPVTFALGLLIRGFAIARVGFLLLFAPIRLLISLFSGLFALITGFTARSILLGLVASIGKLGVALRLLFPLLLRFAAFFLANPLGLFLTATSLIIMNWQKIVSIFIKAKNALLEFLGISKKDQDIKQNLSLKRTFNPELTQRGLDAFGVNQTKAPNTETNNTINMSFASGTTNRDKETIKQSVIEGMNQSVVNDLFQVRLQQ